MKPKGAWDLWQQGFEVWEKSTADLMETWLRSPLVLGPAGTLLTSVMKSKAASDKMTAAWWSAWGLPTKRDQERTLHALNELESRLLDLEERMLDER